MTIESFFKHLSQRAVKEEDKFLARDSLLPWMATSFIKAPLMNQAL